MSDKTKRLIIALTISFGITAIVGIIVVMKLVFNVGFVCTVHEVTGLNCPGCGATRMAIELIHMNIYQAFRYNPFIFVTAPIIFVVYAWQSAVYVKYNKFLKYLDKFLITYAILLLSFGIIRNIKIFSWLAPTVV